MDEKKIKPIAITEDVWMVPCTISKDKKDYKPIGKPFNYDYEKDRSQSRQSWLLAEDQTLKEIISQRGPHHWSLIAREVNNIVHNSMPIRQGKQCRERWYNHLDYGLKKGNWSNQEDVLILEKQLEWGNKWSDIARMLIGRTENQVKNRWKSITKKAEKTCPKGFDPIKILISEMKAEPDMTTLNSMMPVSPILSPGFLYPFGDLGFSSMADQIKSVYQLGMASINNPDPSPSTLLFLSSPHMRH